MALRDSKDLFKIAEEEFGFCMTVLDIGGGFPGETHSTWNPSTEIDDFDDNKNLDESNMGNLDDKSNTDRTQTADIFRTQIAPSVSFAADKKQVVFPFLALFKDFVGNSIVKINKLMFPSAAWLLLVLSLTDTTQPRRYILPRGIKSLIGTCSLLLPLPSLSDVFALI